MIRLIAATFFFVFWAMVSPAQSKSAISVTNYIDLSTRLTNNVISTGSASSVFVEMKNISTNIVSMAESSPEQVFSVFLTGASGTTYQITPTFFSATRLMELNLKPGERHGWVIHVWVNRYFEPPGFIPTNKNVPVGSYALKVVTKVAVQNQVFDAESNQIEIQIK